MTILPPCPTEDSNFCYWDAATRGNGQGHSFITLFDTTFYNPSDALPWPMAATPFIYALIMALLFGLLMLARGAVLEGNRTARLESEAELAEANENTTE